MTGVTTGQTPLPTATDSDDTENFLTVSLTAALQTLTNLFDSVTGHKHTGSGQGGPIAISSLVGSIANATLAADVARANQLANGGHEIWQRGNGPFTANNAYATDRYQIGLVGTDTLSVSRNTAQADTGSVACSACTFVLGSGGGATNYAQLLKAADGYQLAGRTISVSARRRTATAAAIRVGVTTNGTGGGTSYSAFHTGGGAYETLTVPNIPVPADATLVTVFTAFAASCTAYCDNDNVTVGAVAGDYVPLSPADDLARALRYYQRFNAPGNHVLGFGEAYSTTQAFVVVPMLGQMAGIPTVTVSAAADWGLTNTTFTGTAANAVAVSTANVDHVMINVTLGAAVLVAGNSTAFRGQTANAWLALEYNP